MIQNAAKQIASQNPEYPKEDDFNAFQISEVLAVVLLKRKEDILMDIVNYNVANNI
jgi:hypothetical protein